MPLRTLVALLCFHVCSAASPDWDNLRSQIKSTLHVPSPLPKIADKSYGSFDPAPGVAADRVSYATDYDLRIPAVVYHPAGATITKHPALIIVNGHAGDKSSWYAYWAGILYARAGAVVLTYDPIGEYERNSERRSRTGQHDEIVQPEKQMATRMAGQMITDVMQAVTYLSSRRDVDPKRIAVAGFSMGTFVSALTCAVDPRIDACVFAGGGDLDGPGGHWDNAKPMCEGIPYQSLSFLGDRGAVLFALNAKRGPTFIYNGTADETEDIPHHGPDFFADLHKRAAAQLGNDKSSKNLFEYGFVQGGKHAPYFLTRPVALWLEEKLKFPDWTKKQLAQLRETQIGNWATANHLDQASDKGFQENVAPMSALGNNIPIVPRAELHALPEAVWDAERNSYNYDTWVDRAKAAVESGAP